MGLDVGVDLGTASILIYLKGKGVVLREPSMVAMDRQTRRIIAVGEEARRMLGRTPGDIVVVRPLREGVIADYEITEKMLRYYLKKICGRRFWGTIRVMICIPSGVTGVEERAVRQAATQAGARQVFLIEEPLAAALGADLNITAPQGNMVVDIGGGTCDIAVLSLGGIVLSSSIRVGGDKFDEAIIRFLRREFNLLLGERSAEELKIQVGSARPGYRENSTAQVRGRDLVNGLPRMQSLTTNQVAAAIAEPLDLLVGAVKEILEQTPPELAADIMDKGIVLTGGGALLHGLDTLLVDATGVPVHVADDPISCVVLGAGKALANLSVLQSAGSLLQRN